MHVFVYMKVEPVLQEIRTMFNNPEFLKSLETVVKRIPDIETKLPEMRARMAKFAEMRAAKTLAAQA